MDIVYLYEIVNDAIDEIEDIKLKLNLLRE